MKTHYKPAAHPAVVPYLVVEDADKAVAFMHDVFDAIEMRVSRNAAGRVDHAEMAIADAVIMVAEASGSWLPTPAALYIYVPDVDAVHRRAIASGAASLWEPVNQPYGDRNSGVKDSNGVQWWIATHREDVSA